MIMWDDGWGHMHGYGWALMILFWLLIIAVVGLAVRAFILPRQSPPKEKSALEILDERYARGEIDHEEYEQRRKRLESKSLL